MTLRLFLLGQPAAAFPVDVEWITACGFPVILTEQILQPVQQPCCGKECRRVAERIQMLQQKLCIDVSLRCGGFQQRYCLFLITGNIPTAEIQLGSAISKPLPYPWEHPRR